MDNIDSPSKDRRHYPKNLFGGKEEWTGIHQHQIEINQELRTLESQIKELTKKTLLDTYDEEILARFEERRQELENKKLEGKYMQMKGFEYQEALKKIRQDKEAFYLFMRQNYDYHMEEKQLNSQKEKEEKLSYENNLNEFNRKKLESERKRRLEQKYNLKKEVDVQINLVNEKNKQKKEEKIASREEFNTLSNQKALQEIMKEEGYKNFYKQWSEREKITKAIHENNFTNQENARRNQIKEVIDKQIEETNKKQKEKEIERIQRQLNDKYDMINTVKEQINAKNQIKEVNIIEKQIKQDQRLHDLKNYNDYLYQQKMEKLERQNQYRQMLNQQKEMTDNYNLNKNRMTVPEKKMNFEDLQAYKEINPTSYSQLIGYSPQIGAYSNRIKTLPNNEPQQTSLLGQTLSKLKITSSPAKNLEAQKELNSSFTKLETKKLTKIDDLKNTSSGYQQYSPSQIFSYNHNPLVNPLPVNIQNPYVAREYMKAQTKNNNQNIFSGLADRNLTRKI